MSAQVRNGATDISNTYTAWFDYDRHGNLDSLSFDGLGGLAELEYLRDGLGRVDEVLSHADAGTATIASNIVFDEFGAVTSADLGNGTSATWSYAPYRHLLEQVEHLASDGLELGRVEYDYDANGNVTWETRYRDSADDDDYLSLKAHTYDGLDPDDDPYALRPSLFGGLRVFARR